MEREKYMESAAGLSDRYNKETEALVQKSLGCVLDDGKFVNIRVERLNGIISEFRKRLTSSSSEAGGMPDSA